MVLVDAKAYVHLPSRIPDIDAGDSALDKDSADLLPNITEFLVHQLERPLSVSLLDPILDCMVEVGE